MAKLLIVFSLVLSCFSHLSNACADDSLTVPPEVLEAQKQRIEVMRRCAAATVSVFGLDGGGGGSGVLISPDGYALTNYHVSSACGDHMRCGLNDGKMYDAVIVGVDAVGDVSLIRLVGRDDFPTAPMGDSSQLRVGQWCFSSGNPFGLASNRQPSISLGLISGINRYQYPSGTILEYADCIQTDAAVNPGNSGGPLFNLAGEVIGINGRCSFEKRGRINVGVGYAISMNQIRTFLSMLKSGRLLDHATLGATVTTDDSGRVVVSNILSNSDAYRRGLRYGDEIVRFADREVTTTNSFKNILGTLPKDYRVPLEFKREGKSQTILARLTGVHTPSQLNKIVELGLDGQPDERKPKPGQKPKEGEGDKKPDSPPTEEPEPKSDPKSDGQAKEPQIDPKSGKLYPGVPDFKLVDSMLELREGFSNYYFNRQARQSIYAQMAALGDFANVPAIRLRGKLIGESTKVDVLVSGEQMDVTVGSRRSQYKGDISDVIAERKFGGVGVAYRALKELLQQGPEKIGETVYLGQFPVFVGQSLVLKEQPLHEVLETSWYDSKVRYSWDTANKQVSLIEIFGDEGTDPAEVYFDRYKSYEVGSKAYSLPSRIRLQYGMDILMSVEVDEYLLGSEAAANGEAASSAGGAPGAEPAKESKP
ncbi:MAG: trypsin-like peptidase domain-containing protein [Pirellulales bacterium]